MVVAPRRQGGMFRVANSNTTTQSTATAAAAQNGPAVCPNISMDIF